MPSFLPVYESRHNAEDPRSTYRGTGYDRFISYTQKPNRPADAELLK
jgi:hypothetical protein